MDPPDFEALNLTAEPAGFTYPRCEHWRPGSEGSVFHLAHILLLLGFMGGSSLYGLLYLFTLLTLGFFCSTLWSWSDPCSSDAFLWTLAQFVSCLAQLVHVSYRLRSVTFDKDFEDLYKCVFKRLGVSLAQYARIVQSCEQDVQTLERDHCFAVEGKTPIDKLSVLLSGRIRVTVNGEFLHYIYPFQFLDSPEWDSLRPSEEGVFQVTLRADNRCRYVTWRRKRLYLLFAKHRYIAKVFALVVRNDIADKLYSLNDKAFDESGHRYDLRLPSFCHPPHRSPHLSPEDNQGPHLSPEDNQGLHLSLHLSPENNQRPHLSPEDNQGLHLSLHLSTEDNQGPQMPSPDNQKHYLPTKDNQEQPHPSPVKSSPASPMSVKPLNIIPSPVTPSPVTPSSVDPSPVDPSPVTFSPVDPSPVTLSPVTPSSVDPSPVTPSPVTLSPVDPSPVTLSPVDPSPVNPLPVIPIPARRRARARQRQTT